MKTMMKKEKTMLKMKLKKSKTIKRKKKRRLWRRSQ
jgi:hypothetical protein